MISDGSPGTGLAAPQHEASQHGQRARRMLKAGASCEGSGVQRTGLALLAAEPHLPESSTLWEGKGLLLYGEGVSCVRMCVGITYTHTHVNT